VELDYAIGQRKQRVIATAADVAAGLERRATLANDDAAELGQLTAVQFHAAKLRVAVAPVTS
jgi:hypothetical protein